MISNQIVRTIGIDVHKEAYQLSTYDPVSGTFFAEATIKADSKNVIKYVKRLESQAESEIKVLMGYEAGPTGFGLKRDLEDGGLESHVMAPTSIYRPAGGVKTKTDIRDARSLAKALYWGSYSEVVPLSKEDEAVRDYIRMRNDRKEAEKKAKQQLHSFLLRHDRKYTAGRPWTQKHMKWLKDQKFKNPIERLTFMEYLNEVTRLSDAIELLDGEIEELSKSERYKENVAKLRCFAGIDTHIAMVLLSEIGDFNRFPTAEQFASYLGLCPGEHSSGETKKMRGITKAGNSHCRKMLIESANSIAKCLLSKKSKRLISRQKGMDPSVIAYADRGTSRIKKKYFHLLKNGKNVNVAKAASARELACFIWGMMTNNMETI